MLDPGWLLLVWSGAAATALAAVAGTVLGGPGGNWLLIPRARRGAGATALSLLAGAIAYPILYGVAFEVVGRADILSGLLLGSAHAAVMFAAARPMTRPGPAARVAAMHIVYGIAIGFLYVTP